jgi:hypothetical protein
MPIDWTTMKGIDGDAGIGGGLFEFSSSLL